MSVHQRKSGRWIVKFPTGPLPCDPGLNPKDIGRGIQTEAADRDVGTILVVSARKGGRESRLIPLNADFKRLLEQWKVEDGDNSRYLITWRGRPIKRIVGAFKRAKRKAKIDPNRKLPPYAFRHAFVTAALNAGGDLKGVSEMAGHSRTETTTRIYQHTNINLHRGIVENLPPITFES